MNRNEILIVDGMSGFGTPIAKDFLEDDLVKTLDIPLVFAISAQCTDINNILLSINRAKEMDIEINGVIVNDYTEEKRLLPKLIEEYSGAKILGVLPFFENDTDPSELISETINNINLENVFKMKIAKL
jgi:dethiobiotin synthetase